MAKNSLKEAPYIKVYSYVDKDGNSTNVPRLEHEALATYVYPGNDKLEWRPNDPFEATLELVTSSRGRSSAVYIYRDIATDVQYTLFLSSVAHMLRHATIKGGRVSGIWHVVKRGQNYGLDMLEAL